MPYAKIYIDAMLLNWGDRLFQAPFRHVRAQQLQHAGMGAQATRMREQLTRTLRRTPEVMLKITNRASGAQGMGAVRRHLRYISRNGQVELEDQNGDRIAGREAVHDLVQTWRLGGWGMPETSHRREVFNILLSMPPGTNRQAVRNAARDFAALEFGDGRAYVFAAHDDEAHPHVHLSVLVRGPDGRRLNPRRQDLRQWRERFAEQLREYGVDANATPRRTRGVTRRYAEQGVAHMLARDEVPKYWRPAADGKQRQAAWQSHDGVFVAWRQIARTMARSPSRLDREMAVNIADFVQTMPVQRDAPMVDDRLRKKELVQAERMASERDYWSDSPGPDVER